MMRRCDDGRVGVAAADERRRSDPGVSETWRFDVADAASGLGVVVRLAFRPAERTAWWWIGAVGCGPPLVALRADDVPIPARGTDVRTDGLWASVRCETPLEHWSVAVECFAVAYDDPWEALRGERGDVVPFGVDLEWEAAAPAEVLPGGSDGYGQWCTVSGEVLLGDDRLEVASLGYREHAWGAAAELGERSVRLPGGETGEMGETVGVCPFAVPGGGWVEELVRTGRGAGWVGRPYTRS